MKVKIKTWDAMVSEFGVDSLGSIDIQAGFTDAMERSMPEDRVIDVSVNDDSDFFLWESEDDFEWDISNAMIEAYLEDTGYYCCPKCGAENNYPTNMTCVECGGVGKALAMANKLAEYIKANPGQRFWQALRNCTDYDFIYVSDELIEDVNLKDTFYME